MSDRDYTDVLERIHERLCELVTICETIQDSKLTKLKDEWARDRSEKGC